MSLVDDTSIPFPAKAPEVWDSLRLKGASGKVYVWPTRPTLHGVVRVRLKPPPIHSKTSKKAGAKKPRVKDIGAGLGEAQLDFEVTERGWPTFVNLWRMLAEEKDGPWRLLHPTADTFDMRGFKVKVHVEITDTLGGVTKATATIAEIDPDTQAGQGASAGVDAKGAKAYTDAANQDWIDEQIALATAKIKVNQLATKADLNRKNGQKAEERSTEKAIAYGKVTL
jgi:hypothetical protein